jgi:four helix bundle protein
MNRFKELKAWQKSINLAVQVYRLTEGFPKKEQFGLISQMNRSCVSIASNMAEGAGRNSNKEFKNFLSIAQGSCFELETQIIIAVKLDYIVDTSEEDLIENLNEVQNMIFGLQNL